MGATVGAWRKSPACRAVQQRIANESPRVRADVDRLARGLAAGNTHRKVPEHADRVDANRSRAVQRSGNSECVREPDAWAAIIEQSSERFTGAAARELADALDGIEAAKQARATRKRVAGYPQRCTAARDCPLWPTAPRAAWRLYVRSISTGLPIDYLELGSAATFTGPALTAVVSSSTTPACSGAWSSPS